MFCNFQDFETQLSKKQANFEKMQTMAHNISADDLYWLDADGLQQPAVHILLYGIGFYVIRLLDPEDWWQYEAFLGQIKKDSNVHVPWEKTKWTSRTLLQHGFDAVNHNIICAVRDGTGRAFILCVYTRDIDGTALSDLGEYALKRDGTILRRGVAGQSIVDKRGTKRQNGRMLMYGTHNLYGINATREGLPSHWQPAAYLPSGTKNPILYTKLKALARHMSSLEEHLTPAVAASRRAQLDDMDPAKTHRICNECAGPALSLTTGYVVSPHDDSGINNEAILFVNRDGPMPFGHEWSFAVAGMILQLPTKMGDAAHLTIAPHIYHGTLPTSSTMAHLRHGNLAAALVTRKDLAESFAKQKARGDATPARFTASRVYAAKKPMKRIKR